MSNLRKGSVALSILESRAILCGDCWHKPTRSAHQWRRASDISASQICLPYLYTFLSQAYILYRHLWYYFYIRKKGGGGGKGLFFNQVLYSGLSLLTLLVSWSYILDWRVTWNIYNVECSIKTFILSIFVAYSTAHQCRLSILRSGNVPSRYFRHFPVNYKVASPMSPVDFRKC